MNILDRALAMYEISTEDEGHPDHHEAVIWLLVGFLALMVIIFLI